MKRILLLFLLFDLVALLSAQTTLDSAVNFTVKDVDGTTWHLYDLLNQGNSVVLDFFTVTCGPCATYAPEVSESYRHFGCNAGNTVYLGINWGADNNQVVDFGKQNGVAYPEISGLEGNGNHVVSDYNVLSYPTCILIKPDHHIAAKYIWPPSTVNLDSAIMVHGGEMMNCTSSLNENEIDTKYNCILSLAPIPADTYCRIKLQHPLDGISCMILNSSGQLVKQFEMESDQGSLLTLDTHRLVPGFYMLKLMKNGIILGAKALIIQ
ncbi:MAG: TlpA family protein disulfide reductase [Bacteroidetes bacterium]|nr:TlpA family protein disulfide reductase [Bacteroidota bacterium]